MAFVGLDAVSNAGSDAFDHDLADPNAPLPLQPPSVAGAPSESGAPAGYVPTAYDLAVQTGIPPEVASGFLLALGVTTDCEL